MPRIKPSLLSASSTASAITLRWDEKGASPKYYGVLRDGTALISLGGTVKTYADTAVTSGLSYTYKIRSYGSMTADGEAFSNSVTIGLLQATAAPVLTGTAGAAQVSLSWTAVANADTYELQRKTGAGSYSEINDADVLAYLNTGLTNGTTYTYRVRGTANTGTSVGPWSNEVAKTPVSTVPVAPTLTGDAGDSENTLDWNTVANAATYRLRRQVGTNPITTFADTTATDYIDNAVINNTTYQYTVCGVTTAGVPGSMSEPLNLTPVAAAPSGLPTIDPGYGATLRKIFTDGTLTPFKVRTYPDAHIGGSGQHMTVYNRFSNGANQVSVHDGYADLRCTRQPSGSLWNAVLLATSQDGVGSTYGYGVYRFWLRFNIAPATWQSAWLYDTTTWTALEIDFPEMLENLSLTAHVLGSGLSTTGIYGMPKPADLATVFHEFKIERRSTFVAFSIDGVERGRLTGTMPSRSLAIMLDSKVGFPWMGSAGAPSSQTPDPTFLHVAAVTVDP